MYIEEIEKFRKKGSTDEWYICKLIDKCIEGLTSETAFSEIEKIVPLIIKEDEWDIFLNHCQYVLQLARTSNTTDMPDCLESNIALIKQKVIEFELTKHAEVRELYKWYRV